MSARNTGNCAEQVYAAAQQWVNCALRSNDSLFTPGQEIWTPELLRELHTRVLNRPDEGPEEHLKKLERQLTDSPPEVYQLMGEVLYLHYLPVYIKPETKKPKWARYSDGRRIRWKSPPKSATVSNGALCSWVLV